MAIPLRLLRLVFAILIFTALAGCPVTPGPSGEEGEGEGETPAHLALTSSAFADDETIPERYTADGNDLPPPLAWTRAGLDDTASFALICEDLDAPGGSFVHWVIYGISPGTAALAEGLPSLAELSDGTRQGINDFESFGYDGPDPPSGPAHRYRFTLYALDTALDLPPGASRDEILGAAAGHILARAVLSGRYGRI